MRVSPKTKTIELIPDKIEVLKGGKDPVIVKDLEIESQSDLVKPMYHQQTPQGKPLVEEQKEPASYSKSPSEDEVSDEMLEDDESEDKVSETPQPELKDIIAAYQHTKTLIKRQMKFRQKKKE